MTAQPYTINGGINPLACLEQITILECLYKNNQDYLKSCIAITGGGQILKYYWTQEGLPVSYVIWQQNTSIFITVCGTVNKTQAIADCLGYYGVPWLGRGSFVNGYFLLQAQNIYDVLQGIFPNGLNQYHFNLLGHSLGGASAWCLAQMLSQDIGGDKVSVICLGAPKSTDDKFSAPLPVDNYLVVNNGDVISDCAPNIPNLIAPFTFTTIIGALTTNWIHQQTCLELDASGNLTEKQPYYFNSPAKLAVDL